MNPDQNAAWNRRPYAAPEKKGRTYNVNEHRNIEGLPPGTKIARIGTPRIGEYIPQKVHQAVTQRPSSSFSQMKLICAEDLLELGDMVVPVLAADNVYHKVNLHDVPNPAPNDFERAFFGPVERFRLQYWIGIDGRLCHSANAHGGDKDWERDIWCVCGAVHDNRRIHLVPREKKVKLYLVGRWLLPEDALESAGISDILRKLCPDGFGVNRFNEMDAEVLKIERA